MCKSDTLFPSNLRLQSSEWVRGFEVKLVAAVNGVRSGEVSVADFLAAVSKEVKAMSRRPRTERP